MNSNNPFQKQDIATRTAGTDIEQSRAIQEVQAAIVVAKKFPRDQYQAVEEIKKAFSRPSLAEKGLYAFPRGSTMVTGPSIRAAEAIAREWGNIQFAIREIDQQEGSSVIEAYAWDLEKNVKESRVFTVQHVRRSGGSNKKLTDPRDIYEMTANQGARRLRACILAIIPADVVDTAVRQIEVTQAQNNSPADMLDKIVEKFDEYGVTVEMLEEKLCHNMDATSSAEIISLKATLRSIKDGMAGVEAFFPVSAGKPVVDMPESASDPEPEPEPYYDPETGELVPDHI